MEQCNGIVVLVFAIDDLEIITEEYSVLLPFEKISFIRGKSIGICILVVLLLFQSVSSLRSCGEGRISLK